MQSSAKSLALLNYIYLPSQGAVGQHAHGERRGKLAKCGEAYLMPTPPWPLSPHVCQGSLAPELPSGSCSRTFHSCRSEVSRPESHSIRDIGGEWAVKGWEPGKRVQWLRSLGMKSAAQIGVGLSPTQTPAHLEWIWKSCLVSLKYCVFFR